MKSLDTNIVLRFLLHDVPTQDAKVRQLFSKPPLYVSDVVVAETAFVLEKWSEFDRNETASLLRTLLAVPGLSFNDKILPEAIELFQSRKSLSFVDSYAAVEARIFGINLITFDMKLLNQGGSHAKEPE